MVHINQVELTHFKSFGGSITIPLEEGFTVVTGPNGSGKSNILDGVLFCLGLANSRGMRADRLPDLVNSAVLRDGKATLAEAGVTAEAGVEEGWAVGEKEEVKAGVGAEVGVEGAMHVNEVAAPQLTSAMMAGPFSTAGPSAPAPVDALEAPFRRVDALLERLIDVMGL